MRFTASANWLLAQEGAYRRLAWTVEMKKTTSLSDALTAGTWMDVSKYCGDTFFPIGQRIEFEVGQFTSDSVTVTASFMAHPSLPSISAVQWFKANIFNASASEYIETKIKATMRIGDSAISTDVFYAFTGFADKANVEYNERADTVTFTIYTADELGNRITAESITTQYVNEDVDGSGTDGIILPNIPGIWVTDANVASYVLKKGTHIIEYDYNSGSEQARLDGGDWVTLPASNGTATLISEDGLEKVTVYVKSTAPSQLSNSANTLTDYIVVTTPGTTLPDQPLFGLGLRYTLKALYSKIGITDITCDTLQFASNDGNPKFSYYDIPPQDLTKTGAILGVANNGTDLFIAVGDTVYRRASTAETASTIPSSPYTSLTTKAGYAINRLWYNARNNDLWIWFSQSTTRYIRIYHVGSATYDEFNLPNSVVFTTADVIDYNYSGSNYVYGLVYTHLDTAVKFVSNTGVGSTIFTAADMGYAVGYGPLDVYLFLSGANVYFQSHDASNIYYHKIHVDVAGTWFDDGQALTLTDQYTTAYPAMLHVGEGRIYYIESSGGTLYVKSHTLSSGTPTTITSFSATTYDVQCMIYANSKVYYFRADRTTDFNQGYLYSLAANAVTTEYAAEGGPRQPAGFAVTYLNSTLYGVDITRRLWRYSSTLNMHIKQPNWQGVSVKAALDEVLKSYNLIGTLSSHKKAFIYRRGNDSGTIQTTGNTMTINKTNCVDITQVENAFQKRDWVEVSNGMVTYSYDGTTFNARVLSDASIMTLSNPLIPDAMVKDVCKYIFLFYNVNHDAYRFMLNTAPMQYEVMDGAAVTFTDTRIAKTGTGLIQSFGFDKYGNVTCEVLF